MKNEINSLINLAKDYVVFGVEIGLPQTHNHIRGGHQCDLDFIKMGDLISIYLANNSETWSVTFKDVVIVGYSSAIQIPFDANEEYLRGVYDSAKKYLVDYLLKDVAKVKLSTMKARHNKIKQLERDLRKLKGLI